MGAEVVAEEQPALPVRPAHVDDVHVELTSNRPTLLEEAPIRDHHFGSRPVRVADSLQGLDASLRVGEAANPHRDVDDRLGGQPGDGRATDVLYLLDPAPERR